MKCQGRKVDFKNRKFAHCQQLIKVHGYQWKLPVTGLCYDNAVLMIFIVLKHFIVG